jgi:type VI secretion system protein ImpA
MSAPALLDFDALTAPLTGDDGPAGSPLPGDIKRALDTARTEVDDPSLPPEDQRKADWPLVVRLCQEALSQKSRDLLTAARLAEGLIKVHGVTGLWPGLHLMRLMVEQCWDRMHPSIEDGDLEVRAAPFNWLDAPDRGARFPYSVRLIPIVFGKGASYSFVDFQQSSAGKGEVPREDFEKAVGEATHERCSLVAGEIGRAIEEVRQTLPILEEKLKGEAPSLLGLRQALEDCNGLAQQILSRKAPAASPDGQETTEESASGGRAGPRSGVATRADIYQRISELATQLADREPHSPVPHLLQYAIRLGEMPYPQLMKELVRSNDVLVELSRILGIKELAE